MKLSRALLCKPTLSELTGCSDYKIADYVFKAQYNGLQRKYNDQYGHFKTGLQACKSNFRDNS